MQLTFLMLDYCLISLILCKSASFEQFFFIFSQFWTRNGCLIFHSSTCSTYCCKYLIAYASSLPLVGSWIVEELVEEKENLSKR